MATSSSEECSTAPMKDFHLPSAESISRSSLHKQKCTLCGSFRKVFYCKECLHSGSFFHSKKQLESYQEKRRALLELEDHKIILQRKCMKQFETRQKADLLRAKIRQCHDKNRIMKLALEEKRRCKCKYEEGLKELRSQITNTRDKLLKYDRKVAQIKDVAADKQEKVESDRKVLLLTLQEIMKLVKMRIEELKFIFPITRIEPREIETMESDMVSAIAEASQTMYIKDRWEYTDFSMDLSEVQYKVVEPTLPSSGNYSLYNMWVSQNKDSVPVCVNPDIVEHNPAYNISAALTYTAQLLHVLAFYFNVRLPFRMIYSDFCGNYMEEAQFTRRVSRLNANILYLCFSQRIDLATINPCETIRNLLRLIDITNPNMGNQGPFEVKHYKEDQFDDPFSRELPYADDNTDSEEGDSFHREWETVPHISQDVPTATSVMQSAQMITTQQASSVAGGLVTSAAASIASMWRGFTGR